MAQDVEAASVSCLALITNTL